MGKLIRERYDNYLPLNYSPLQIYVRSSNYNRTILSAKANLAGIFNNKTQFISNLNLNKFVVDFVPKEKERVGFFIYF